MKRVLVLLALLVAVPASAHVGSYDVFFSGEAGPYHLDVTVRMPQVIPGVAEIEIRARDADVTGMTVVPLRLSGPGSELPPTPDRAERSTPPAGVNPAGSSSGADSQFFTASLWLMERGAMQVRVAVEGARGAGQLAVPINAVARKTLGMDRPLAALLLGLMAVLALSIISIAGAAAREGGLDPGVEPSQRARRTTRIAMVVAGAVVVVVLGFGQWWWSAEAASYERMIMKEWKLSPTVSGCTLRLPYVHRLLPDHDHEMHLFVVRVPELDRLAHLHPVAEDGYFVQSLPSLPACRYALFADVVFEGGFPMTGIAEIEVPALDCPTLQGDDSQWDGTTSQSIKFERPLQLRAGESRTLRFDVVDASGAPATDVEPYMAMAGHAAVLRRDRSVFAHLHPHGSVAMPALMLARTQHEMHRDGKRLPPHVAFPYGFPREGEYRVFVQIKRAGRIETAAFDVSVAP